jgi:hypothetical protein
LRATVLLERFILNLFESPVAEGMAAKQRFAPPLPNTLQPQSGL